MRVGYNPKNGRIKTDVGITIDRAFIAHINIPAASAVVGGNATILALTDLAEAAADITAGITNPAWPRVLQVIGNAATAVGNVVITGTNFNDEAITETIVANGTTIVSGTKAFKTITKITLPALGAAGDKISVGTNAKLGLPYKLAHNTVLAAYVDNAKEGTAPTVVCNATTLEANTIALNTALSGKAVDVYLMV